ncbi:hypothetical protein ABEB36_009166 [Hypothenemus hampei]|uniref:C2H2-type domain-containing protein n=1 Tax=Hypothenemus hampei TaxID=57062 RepID=A0ABD1EPC6_HYPHA
MSVPSMVHRSEGASSENSTVRNAVFHERAVDVSDAAADEDVVVDDHDDVDVVLRSPSPPVAAPAANNESTTTSSSASSLPIRGKDLPDCKVRRNYTCQCCEFFTQNPRQYLYHLRDVHKQKINVYECPNCLYASKHFQKLLRHSKMVHGTSEGVNAAETSRKSRRRSYEEVPTEEAASFVPSSSQDPPSHFDPEEDSSIAIEEEIVQDIDDHQHQQDAGGAAGAAALFKCSVCAFSTRNRVQLNKHEREEHIKTKFFRCSKCTYVTHIKARYTKHVKYHSMPMIKCDMCDFRTPYKWNLDRHCKNHNGKGAFRCSACNFTADIKQSLTVHEMNHHVPPVGQAAGLGVGRRRNKVGASDTTAAEEAASSSSTANQQEQQIVSDVEEPLPHHPQRSRPKIKITPKKTKVSITNNGVITSDSFSTSQGKFSEFVHPDDIVQHSNGKVYIKNKCKLCNYKTAWESEMAKHEKQFHNIGVETIKKTSRPVPNLIPINKEPVMSQKDINEICSRSANSALKDFASLFVSEDVFKSPTTSKVPDLIPTSIFSSASKSFKQKNASFFDHLKEKLELGTGCNLLCALCGHESKCLTEQAKHKKICGKETNKLPNFIPKHNISASRCQFCRQRCKSSADLYTHLQTCLEALKYHEVKQEEEQDSEHENELKIDEDRQSVEEEYETKPHPMENKVFVWNDIMVPMDIDVDDSNYEYTDDRIDDNVSLDLSIRNQSPSSENSYFAQDNNNTINLSNNNTIQLQQPQQHSRTQHSPMQSTEKIPTHGNDISVAQHKRVFKCPHCTFWASTASRFHVHIVGHLNKKPFECSLCSYRSNWRWDITKHIKLKSVRDQAHESAKVLMTDETGRRNYTKYNKYLTEIPLSSLQSSNETSGGSGTRPKNHEKSSGSPSTSRSEKSAKFPTSGELNTLLKGRSVPGLRATDKQLLSNVTQEKKRSSDGKRTLFKCKKCNFRDASRDILLQHVKGHYEPEPHILQELEAEQMQEQQQQLFRAVAAAAQVTLSPSPLSLAIGGSNTGNSNNNSIFSSQDLSLRGTSPDRDEASVNNNSPGTTKGGNVSSAPFRCGHCNQVSNWKHVIQRHCRLKHSGDIRVVSTKNGQEKIEIDEQLLDDPDDLETNLHFNNLGQFKCAQCPFNTDNQEDYQDHLNGHTPNADHAFTCSMCQYGVNEEKELSEHLKLHAPEYVDNKKFRCCNCPYVTNSKSQYTHHRQFHKDRGGPYTCSHCSYNVSKRHLLHQHLKVHGINVSPSKHTSEIEEILNKSDLDATELSDIPLVWVSKDGKFSKMFKCRYCPHMNLRKVNIQEHEKMHGSRVDLEHQCPECNYMCNNAGVLSSHLKVHQGLYGTVHGLVDSSKSDEEQINEWTKGLNADIDTSDFLEVEMEEIDPIADKSLYFCKYCPARFLKENEFVIHQNFHNCDNQEFKCDHCTYATDNETYLSSHFKVHFEDYQERTKILKGQHSISANHSEPVLITKTCPNGEQVWIVEDVGPKSNNILATFLSKPLKSTVPLSGTDLFQQRSEAQQRQLTEQNKTLSNHTKLKMPEPINDLTHGNPDFVYQTCIKNGRTKEKRYKCHKCPSAFEKREQYKVHLGLHGSQQRYSCDSCDYSVKYYANYVQHLKKHKFNEDAQAAKRGEHEEVSDNDNEDIETIRSVADQQMTAIQVQQREKSNDFIAAGHFEEKKLFSCPHCPYTSGRRDALDNHLKRHECVSGTKSTFSCEHCDYSVPQAHVRRDHEKLHFIPNKSNHLNGYMKCDSLKLTSTNVDDDDEASTDTSDNSKETVIYDEEEEGEENTINENEQLEKFNNNKGEQLLNVQIGDPAMDNNKAEGSDLKIGKTNFQMEVI